MALGKNEILGGMATLIQEGKMTVLEGHVILTRELIARLIENKQSGEQLDNINNDRHDELQREVLRMIETKTPPNGERYSERVKRGPKKENAGEFLLRVYAKFKKSEDDPFPLQGIYQDQLGKVDNELLVAINQFVRIRERKTSEFVLPKSERVDKKISLVIIDNSTLFSIHSRFYRDKKRNK